MKRFHETMTNTLYFRSEMLQPHVPNVSGSSRSLNTLTNTHISSNVTIIHIYINKYKIYMCRELWKRRSRERKKFIPLTFSFGIYYLLFRI